MLAFNPSLRHLYKICAGNSNTTTLWFIHRPVAVIAVAMHIA